MISGTWEQLNSLLLTKSYRHHVNVFNLCFRAVRKNFSQFTNPGINFISAPAFDFVVDDSTLVFSGSADLNWGRGWGIGGSLDDGPRKYVSGAPSTLGLAAHGRSAWGATGHSRRARRRRSIANYIDLTYKVKTDVSIKTQALRFQSFSFVCTVRMAIKNLKLMHTCKWENHHLQMRTARIESRKRNGIRRQAKKNINTEQGIIVTGLTSNS